MAQKLGFVNQWLFGNWAERAAINRNAEDLSNVEAEVRDLRAVVQRQAEEILRLRAMFMGVVDQQIVERYGDTKQVVVARQQLDNLRRA